jgi:YhgE/Pip-like protein
MILRVRKIWILPAVLAGVLIGLITLIYVGSVVNPTGHLRGLPVVIVNQDEPVQLGGQQIDFGAKVVSGLTGSSKVSSRLGLHITSLNDAQHRMDNDKAFATIVIPPDLSTAIADLYGLSSTAAKDVPTLTLLTNQRSGSLATNLAAGVTQPAIAAIAHSIGTQLSPLVPARSAPASGAVSALRSDPITVVTQNYQPLPDHSALGLSAFYISLLTLMCGFLGATLINSSIDSATGFAPTELGPRWRLRPPVPMTRWATLRTKWAVAIALPPLFTGVVLLIAVGALRVYAPNVLYLWLFTSFAAIVVAMGTLVFFAVFGSLGQLLAMLIFLYLSLASSGGTVPIEALPEPFRWAADIEPLRQILGGVRSIMYFDASGEAGLTRGLSLTGAGLILWLIVGFAITRFYDKRGMNRISPEALAFVNRSLEQLRVEREGKATDGSSDTTASAPIVT